MNHEDPDSRMMQGNSTQESRGAVDVWLQRELKRRYDETLREPVPDDLLALIERAGN
jgi:hypothetical protein